MAVVRFAERVGCVGRGRAEGQWWACGRALGLPGRGDEPFELEGELNLCQNGLNSFFLDHRRGCCPSPPSLALSPLSWPRGPSRAGCAPAAVWGCDTPNQLVVVQPPAPRLPVASS